MDNFGEGVQLIFAAGIRFFYLVLIPIRDNHSPLHVRRARPRISPSAGDEHYFSEIVVRLFPNVSFRSGLRQKFWAKNLLHHNFRLLSSAARFPATEANINHQS